MPSPRIVLQLDSQRALVRAGEVVADVKGKRRVRWSDGTETEVRLGKVDGFEYFDVVEGSFNHLMLLGPERVQQVLREFPVQTLLLAVRDAPASTKGADPVALLEQAGATGVRDVWKDFRAAFEKSGHVRPFGGPRRYVWTGEDAGDLRRWVRDLPEDVTSPVGAPAAGRDAVPRPAGPPSSRSSPSEPLSEPEKVRARTQPGSTPAPAASNRSAPPAPHETAGSRTSRPPAEPADAAGSQRSPLAHNAPSTTHPKQPRSAPGAARRTKPEPPADARPQKPAGPEPVSRGQTSSKERHATSTDVSGPAPVQEQQEPATDAGPVASDHTAAPPQPSPAPRRTRSTRTAAPARPASPSPPGGTTAGTAAPEMSTAPVTRTPVASATPAPSATPKAAAPRPRGRTATGSVEQLTRQLLQGKITEANQSALQDLIRRPEQGPLPAMVVSAVEGDLDPRVAQRAAGTPLAAGVRLAAYTDDVLTKLAEAAGEQAAAALLVALPRKFARIDDLDLVQVMRPAGAQTLVERALTELRGSATPGDLRAGFDALIERVLASADAPSLGLPTLIQTSAAVAAEGGAGSLILTRLVSTIADVLRRSGPSAVTALSDAERQTLAKALARLPFAGTGPRATVLSVISAADAEEVAHSRWWLGVTFEEIAAVASGPLVGVLEQPAVVGTVVRPLALDAVRHVQTRRGLGQILAASRPVAEALPADAVADALVRVSRTDSPLRSWLDVVRDLDKTRALEAERDQLANDLHHTTVDLSRAREEVERLRTNAARLESRVHEAERAHTSMRGSQERQIRIDAMRALAGLAAFVEGSSDRLEPARLRARVSALVGRQGVRSIETPDDVVEFDPTRHESVGPAIEPGQKVVVRRCGYTWDSPPEEIVLVRALVERVQHKEDR